MNGVRFSHTHNQSSHTSPDSLMNFIIWSGCNGDTSQFSKQYDLRLSLLLRISVTHNFLSNCSAGFSSTDFQNLHSSFVDKSMFFTQLLSLLLVDSLFLANFSCSVFFKPTKSSFNCNLHQDVCSISSQFESLAFFVQCIFPLQDHLAYSHIDQSEMNSV